MQTKLNKPVAGILAGMFLATIAAAHPGHSPADVVAEVSQPLAGRDHFVAFVALVSILLVAVRFGLKMREAKRAKARR